MAVERRLPVGGDDRDRELLRWQVSDDRAAARVELVPGDPRPLQDDPQPEGMRGGVLGARAASGGRVAEPDEDGSDLGTVRLR